MKPDYQCPRCGGTTLRVELTGMATIRFDDPNWDDGLWVIPDPTWDNKSVMECPACGCSGTAKDFDTERQERTKGETK